jgi:hypothetical protein
MMVAKKLHNKHVCKRELVEDDRGCEDVPKFKYFDGRKFRAVMHGMPKTKAVETARDARKRGFYARLVVYMATHYAGKKPEPAYALYVCNTDSKKEREMRNR